MTIEFACQNCGKVLSTSDDKAGRRAKCPGCGEAVQIPVAAGVDSADLEESPAALPNAPRSRKRSVKCPMCGTSNSSSATECATCGEQLDDTREDGPLGHDRLEIGRVLSDSWTIFKGEMGLVIGGVIVAGLLQGVAGIPSQACQFIGEAFTQQGERETGVVFAIAGVALLPLSYLVQWFMYLGLARLLLNVASGAPAGLGDLFSGGRYFWRMVGASILFGIMIVAGLILFIIPGIIVALMFSQYIYVLVDRDPPGIDCLWRSKDVTDGNKGTLFLLGIVAAGINLLGLLAMCIGLIFTIPLTSLIYAVAYLHMTGQRTAA